MISELDDPIKSAFATGAGKSVTLYPYGEESTKENFELDPGEWLTNKGTADFSVITDEEFQKLTAVIR